mmetsp:Transcript_55299/g.165757  ORF Transcript_55299/g.165757 Transcript_55299/m.165757 type:complete len:309 (+) Transcript_55299:421-1347(+)
MRRLQPWHHSPPGSPHSSPHLHCCRQRRRWSRHCPLHPHPHPHRRRRRTGLPHPTAAPRRHARWPPAPQASSRPLPVPPRLRTPWPPRATPRNSPIPPTTDPAGSTRHVSTRPRSPSITYSRQPGGGRRLPRDVRGIDRTYPPTSRNSKSPIRLRRYRTPPFSPPSGRIRSAIRPPDDRSVPAASDRSRRPRASYSRTSGRGRDGGANPSRAFRDGARRGSTRCRRPTRRGGSCRRRGTNRIPRCNPCDGTIRRRIPGGGGRGAADLRRGTSFFDSTTMTTTTTLRFRPCRCRTTGRPTDGPSPRRRR